METWLNEILGTEKCCLLYIRYFVISLVKKQFKTKKIYSLGPEKLVCYISGILLSDLFISSFHWISKLCLGSYSSFYLIDRWSNGGLRRPICRPAPPWPWAPWSVPTGLWTASGRHAQGPWWRGQPLSPGTFSDSMKNSGGVFTLGLYHFGKFGYFQKRLTYLQNLSVFG